MAESAGATLTSPPEPDLGSLVAGSAASLAGRRAFLLVLSAASTVVVARVLGPSSYGQLGSAIATWTLILAGTDFGFTLLLGREIARRPESRGELLRTAYELQGGLAVALSLLTLGIGIVDGLGTTRGACLALLAPSVAFSALGGARAYAMATFQTRSLAMIDVGFQAIQVVFMILAAALDFGASGVAATISAGAILNAVAVARWVSRRQALETPPPGFRRRMIRDVMPIGLSSFLSQVYLVLDLAILGWLASGPTLGDYAAASKLLTVLATLPGLVMAAALPAFSTSAASPEELRAITTRVWHWLVVTTVPMFAIGAICAPVVIHLAVGGAFHTAPHLLRILALAGVIGVLSNFLGTLLVSLNATRVMLAQNVVAIAFNLIGNIVLVPRYGVAAAAWLTVGTEVIVCGASLVVISRRMSPAPWLEVSLRPLAATAVAAAAGLALHSEPGLALVASLTGFAATVAALRGWPADLRPGPLLGGRGRPG